MTVAPRTHSSSSIDPASSSSIDPASTTRSRRVRRLAAAALTGMVLLSAAACSDKSSAGAPQDGANAGNGNVNGGGVAAADNAPQAKVVIKPALTEGRGVPDKPITVSVAGGTLQSVSVKDATGAAANGTMSASGWTPTGGLALDSAYTITATAKNPAGAITTATQSIRTLAPDNTTHVSSVTPSSGAHVGNAQPVVVRFPVTVRNRDAVVKALTISDTSHVQGAWRWMGPARVDFRPKDFWPVGDKVTVTANLQGVQISPGLWGSKNTTSTMVVDSDLQAVASESKHTLTVYKGGKVVRTMPAGLGMPGFRTWTGPMVVISTADVVRMTSCSIGLGCTKGSANFYDMDVHYDVQLTQSGTFVHSAPWDGNLGYANTSHGCIHLSSEDAAWFENTVKIGNLVTVKGVGDKVAADNGYGEWGMTWAQWTAPQK